MAARSLILRLTDIIEAVERIRAVMGDIPLDVFEADWQRQWLVDRGVEIISEASRHLTDELKARHPEILAESGGHRQRSAPQLRTHRRARHSISHPRRTFSRHGCPNGRRGKIPFRPNSLMWLTKF